jgi:hypothetical protein
MLRMVNRELVEVRWIQTGRYWADISKNSNIREDVITKGIRVVHEKYLDDFSCISVPADDLAVGRGGTPHKSRFFEERAWLYKDRQSTKYFRSIPISYLLVLIFIIPSDLF